MLDVEKLQIHFQICCNNDYEKQKFQDLIV